MNTKCIVRTASASDQKAINSFLSQAAAIHRHLDWRSPLDWLGNKQFILVETAQEISALLICTAYPHEVYWLRLFASLNFSSLENHFNILFNFLKTELLNPQSQPEIATIAYYDWMKNLLQSNNWKIHQKVVQLKWAVNNFDELVQKWPQELIICRMRTSDLDIVNNIDHKCFDFIWQQSKDVIQRAFDQSSYTTVAILNEEIVGFQISTSHKSIAHLSRLAIYPKFQGRYIGQALTHNMLKHFRRPWIREITVNTQQDNLISLNLYRKMGFKPTGDNFPIFLYQNS